MKVNPYRYYKECYKDNVVEYSIVYVDEKYVYLIACKYFDKPLIKYKENDKWWGTIKTLQLYSKDIIELTKEDLFLELL